MSLLHEILIFNSEWVIQYSIERNSTCKRLSNCLPIQYWKIIFHSVFSSSYHFLDWFMIKVLISTRYPLFLEPNGPNITIPNIIDLSL